MIVASLLITCNISFLQKVRRTSINTPGYMLKNVEGFKIIETLPAASSCPDLSSKLSAHWKVKTYQEPQSNEERSADHSQL